MTAREVGPAHDGEPAPQVDGPQVDDGSGGGPQVDGSQVGDGTGADVGAAGAHWRWDGTRWRPVRNA